MPKANTTEYKRAFVEKNYDRLAITVPKGQKAAIEAHAKSKGESVNGLVNTLIRADMGLSDEEWKKPMQE